MICSHAEWVDSWSVPEIGVKESSGTTGSTPELPVEHAVIHRFANMLGQDRLAAIQVCDRSRDSQHFIVRAGREAHLLDARAKQIRASVAQFAVVPNLARRHIGIATRFRI